MRHSHRAPSAAVAAVALATVLSGCLGSGSGSSSPQSGPTGQSPPTSQPTAPTTSVPTSPATSGTTSPTAVPTSSSPTTPVGVALRFSPRSDGRHSHTCYTDTGSGTADYVYYPVMVKASTLVGLDSVTVDGTPGITVAGAWVAPAPPNAGTGLVGGWPAPSILTQSTTVQWSKRVTAAGAALEPGAYYNVFLHLVVDEAQLPAKTAGIVFGYHAQAGSQTVTWVDHVTFKPSC